MMSMTAQTKCWPLLLYSGLFLMWLTGCGPDNQSLEKSSNAYTSVDSFAYWNQILSKNPGDVEVLKTRARRYTRDGAFEDALRDYDAIQKLGIPHFTVLLDKAALLSQVGRHHEATITYERALAGAPDKSLLLNARGLEAAERGELVLAIQHLDSALQSNPRMTAAWYNKGSLLFQTGKFEDAEFNFQKALQLERGHGESLSGLGAIYWYIREDKEGAKWYYEQATKGTSGQASGWFGLGNLDLDGGRVESAIFNYEKSVKLNAYQPDAWANLGLAHFQKKDYKAAEESYSKAISLAPMHAQALGMRGLIRCETGKVADGCEDLKKALSAGLASAEKEIARFCGGI